MNSTVKIMIAIAAAAAIGAAAGVLYAPEEGYETRKKIVKRGKKLVGAVNDSIDEGQESLEEIKDILQKQLNKVNRKIAEIRS